MVSPRNVALIRDGKHHKQSEEALFEAGCLRSDPEERVHFEPVQGQSCLTPTAGSLLEGHFRGAGFLTRKLDVPQGPGETVDSSTEVIDRYKLL
jgi:hypothetical protein